MTLESVEKMRAALDAEWDAYQWPEWVPVEVRKQIRQFWGPRSQDRGPDEWALNACADYNGAPCFGARVTLGLAGSHDRETSTGRYVHCWNNIGRLVLDDGSVRCVSTCGFKGPFAPTVRSPVKGADAPRREG